MEKEIEIIKSWFVLAQLLIILAGFMFASAGLHMQAANENLNSANENAKFIIQRTDNLIFLNETFDEIKKEYYVNTTEEIKNIVNNQKDIMNSNMHLFWTYLSFGFIFAVGSFFVWIHGKQNLKNLRKTL